MQVPPADNVICTHCKVPPMCLAPCTGRMYFVLPKTTDTTRACVHLGSHNHHVSNGINCASQEDAKAVVEVEIMQNPRSNPSMILLKTAMSLVQAMVFTKEGSSDPFDNDSLKEVIQHLAPLSRPGIRIHIKSLCASMGRGSLEFNILDLKRQSRYNFIHDSTFPGQGRVKSWLFKMSMIGRGNGVDLVKRMQPGGDLERSWIMFDHVKRVKEWTTMAAHVYEFCKVMTIVICDMKTEDADSQVIFWEGLVEQMKAIGMNHVKFAGWMANAAMANFNAVMRAFDEDPNVAILGKERTCAFHWA